MDDLISVVKRVPVQRLLDHLNSRHGNIQLTVELEKEDSLLVMDLFLHRGKNGKVDVSIYRKPTHT